MAYDPESPPEPEMLLQDRHHLGFLLEDMRKVLQSEDVQVANQPVEDAHEDENRGPVEPRKQLQRTEDRVAHVEIPIVRNVGGSVDEPPELVCRLDSKTRENEPSPQLD